MKQKELDYTTKYEPEKYLSKEIKDFEPKSQINSKAQFTDKQIRDIQKTFDKKNQEFLKNCNYSLTYSYITRSITRANEYAITK